MKGSLRLVITLGPGGSRQKVGKAFKHRSDAGFCNGFPMPCQRVFCCVRAFERRLLVWFIVTAHCGGLVAQLLLKVKARNLGLLTITICRVAHLFLFIVQMAEISCGMPLVCFLRCSMHAFGSKISKVSVLRVSGCSVHVALNQFVLRLSRH